MLMNKRADPGVVLTANLLSKFDDSLNAELHKCLGFLFSFIQLCWVVFLL